MTLKTIRGRIGVIGPGVKQETPITLDPVIYEGSIIYTDDGSLKYSDGVAWGPITGVGFTGSEGDTGFTGSSGDVGFTGSQGAGFTGSGGDTGFTGSQGDVGFTGSQGAGFTGSGGDTGFTGSVGFTGSQGAGFTGSGGDTGFTGSQGDVGFTGSEGAGFTGSAGTEISITTSSSATDHYLTFSAITSGTTSTLLTNTAVEVQPSTGKLKATSFSSTSDAKLKVNINEISEALPVLDKIKSYSFNWKQNGEKSYGVVAQEIENVLPELVSLDTKGWRAVDYNGLIPFLIKAIKELKEELDKK